MFLSIIIPVYNKESYLPECLDSVFCQDIPASDYEVICVDDGSTDRSLSIANQYKVRHGNLRVYSKMNGGVSSARNLGLEHSHGDYVWFIDPDDLIVTNCLGAIRQKCCSESCDLLVVGSYQFVDGTANAAQLQERRLVPDRINHGSTFNKIIRRDLIEKKHVRFSEHMTYAEDALFLHQIGYQPVSTYYPNVVYLYRLNSQSVTKNLSEKALLSRVDSYIHFVEVIDSEIKETPDNRALADKRLYMLSMALFYLVDLPISDRRRKMKELRNKELFPCIRPVNCTIDQLYLTSRTDIVGRLFNYVTVHATSKLGYARLLLLKRVIALKHRAAKSM